MFRNFLLNVLKHRDNLEDTGVDGRENIKMDIKKFKTWIGFIWLRMGTDAVLDSCEHGKETVFCKSYGNSCLAEGNISSSRTLLRSVCHTSQLRSQLTGCSQDLVKQKSKSKAVTLHAMKALGGRGGIAPTHSYARH
jgi:hypothetical protein